MHLVAFFTSRKLPPWIVWPVTIVLLALIAWVGIRTLLWRPDPIITAQPLLWLNDSEILIGHENTLSLYNVDEKRSPRKIYEIEKEKGKIVFQPSCFSEKRWAVYLNQIVGKEQRQYWLEIDWGARDNPVEKPSLDEQQYHAYDANMADCTLRRRKVEPTIVLEGRQFPRFEEIAVRSGDVDRASLYGDGSEFVLALFKGDTVRYVPIEDPRYRRQIAIQGSFKLAFDAQAHRYLAYVATQEFNEAFAKSNWPMKGWWVGQESSPLLSPISLPAGPWVRGYGLLKTLSCFACGCGCYSHIDVQPANGKLYALVWGSGVISGQTGIFELVGSEPVSRWKRLVAETGEETITSSMIFSPNGCKLAYYFGTMKVLNVC